MENAHFLINTLPFSMSRDPFKIGRGRSIAKLCKSDVNTPLHYEPIRRLEPMTSLSSRSEHPPNVSDAPQRPPPRICTRVLGG